MQYVFMGGVEKNIQMLTHTIQTCVVQGSTVFTHFPHPPPPPLGITNLSSVSVSLFLGSKYEKNHSICLAVPYFMQYKALEVHLCCLKQQGFLLFYVSILLLCVYMCVSQFYIHSSIDRHCVSVLAIVNNAAVNVGVHISFQVSTFSSVNTEKWNCWIIQQFCF